jgi:hypothetical protein
LTVESINADNGCSRLYLLPLLPAKNERH